ncbi:DsbA family protein [Terracidiphilus gabretensis]|jgi:protein-disulfide isomerase|uniref:DsbA family protein n=1 Tax=Terracidiphilus gabretensis TaxID=1577687 RepID=UPI00071B337C|nr:DsbA family protein [Terracidiphilus gabretensis]
MSKLSIEVNADDHIQGNSTAECSLVEYGDYECPHCGTAYPIVKRVQKHFGKRLSFVFRNFPLTQIHPWAEPAAEVAEFAGVHGKFWEMHDLLFENQENLGETLFLNLADKLDLSTAQLQTAKASQTYRSRVRADFSGGARSGVNGTPTFFINGRRHNGPFDFDSLSEAIELALR